MVGNITKDLIVLTNLKGYLKGGMVGIKCCKKLYDLIKMNDNNFKHRTNVDHKKIITQNNKSISPKMKIMPQNLLGTFSFNHLNTLCYEDKIVNCLL